MEKENEKSRVEHAKVVESTKTHQYGMFIIVETNNKCRIAVTNKIVTGELFDSLEDAKAYIDSKPWELLVNTCCVIWETIKDKKIEKENKSE